MKVQILGPDGRPFRAQPYEGATRSPRSGDWVAPSVGPNRALSSGARSLRNRTRAGYRNSLLMRSAINKNTTTEIGRGFTLISVCKEEKFRRELNALWKNAVNQLDPWGNLNFNSILHLAVKSRRMSGEVFVRRVRRHLSKGLVVPTQVELIESDLCPMSLYRQIGRAHRIVQGVEFLGKDIIAYWFYKNHPDDDICRGSLNLLERVPARDIVHHYMPSRPGQIRGEPDTAAALLKDRTFHEYDDAELIRKKERSSFTGFLYREGLGESDWEFDPSTGEPLYPDPDKAPVRQTVEPGTMLRGVPGEKLELFDGDDTGGGYKDYVRWQSLMLATGQDIPHALLTGDWSGLNDRLVRAFMIEYRRGISFEQSNLSGFQIAFRIWRWVIEDAILLGKLDAPSFSENPWSWLAIDIRPDAWKHLHPTQEADARTKAISSQTSNVESEAAEFGRDLEDNMVRNARALKRWQEICEQEGVDSPSQMTGVFSPAAKTGINE